MIFLDANVFLRAIVRGRTPNDAAMHEAAAELFRAIGRGEEVATTSEAVLAEVAFVLTSPRQYGLPVMEVNARLKPFLAVPGLELPRGRKHLYLRALDLWADYPRLGFVDALTAAEVERSDIRLATFDTDFDGLPDIARWEAPTAPS